jgi:hypothetical protein
MLSGSMPAGGLAILRIRLLLMWGVPRTATLQVNCALGKVPDERQQVLPARLVFLNAPVAIQFRLTHYRKTYRVSYGVLTASPPIRVSKT